jgi:hypothetical protein
MKYFTYGFVFAVIVGLSWPPKAQELPSLTDFSAFAATDDTDVLFTWQHPTRYTDDNPLPAGKLIATMIKCALNAGDTYPDPDTNPDGYDTLYALAKATPGVMVTDHLAVLVPAPASSFLVPDFAPPLGVTRECRAATIAYARNSDTVVIGSDWSGAAIVGKFLPPARPAAPSGAAFQ